RGGGRGLDVSVGGARRLRRDLSDLLPYEAQMMSYPAGRGGGGNDLYYQADDWRGRGLDQALQRLVESDQRRERQQEEEQEAAYLAALLRLLSEAESAGLVGPGDEEREPGDFRGPAPPDYDETGRALSMGKPPAAWWGRLEPQLAQALLERARQERLQQAGRAGAGFPRGTDQDTLRYLVARILSSLGPSDAQLSSSRRARRDLSVTAGVGGAKPVSPAHRRTRRSLDDMPPPSPSNDPPLLRVKRLEVEEEEEEEEGRRGGGEEESYRSAAPPAGLQRMKRIDTMATAAEEELNHGSRRRRRRSAVNYDPQILIQHILQYLEE
ncbi:proprotein convertase subtilisin/kexin type 1 inhibitor, like, partial [Centroberyx affinis]|uniref:proprotein convertase subtilisin/kexin type 1 inhibitor, like n=1 Tax=Centroberyx affinis TaxID=166261 RepID=UPI003A5C7004